MTNEGSKSRLEFVYSKLCIQGKIIAERLGMSMYDISGIMCLEVSASYKLISTTKYLYSNGFLKTTFPSIFMDKP